MGGLNTPERSGRGGEFSHVSVLLKEAIELLAIKPDGTYFDATVGLGGHSYEIARRLSAAGRLIAVDKDRAALEAAKPRLAGVSEAAIEFRQGPFADIANGLIPASLDGVLADVGVSSLQLDDPARGFSFQAEGPLDMRMDAQTGESAEQVVNQVDEVTLANLIYEFGEERRSRRIARAIVRSRPIRSTTHLALVVSAAARSMKHERIHPATRTFQALRIFVNRELDDLKRLMEAAPTVLKPGGRLVVISFHSLEDRIVKDAIREGVKQGFYEALTRKPVTAEAEEVGRNPRSRSAKLRAARRI